MTVLSMNNYSQGSSGHGKPGKVMEFKFFSQGLEKLWKRLKKGHAHGEVMEIKRHAYKEWRYFLARASVL